MKGNIYMDYNLYNNTDTVIWVSRNGKIQVNTLYRYILSDEGILKVDKKFIKIIKRGVITFTDNTRIKVDRMYSVFGGNMLYLPYRDDKEAINQLYAYCKERITYHKDEINKYSSRADLLSNINENDITISNE